LLVADFGNPTGTIGGQGDIRSFLVQLPVPSDTYGLAREDGRWLPLGGLFRRALAAPDGLPRGVVGENLRFERHARPDGWLPYGGTRLLPEASGAALLPAPAVIASIARDGEAYRVELTAPLPNTAPDAWAGRLALLGNGGNGDVHARSRVLASGPSTLLLAADLPLPEDLAAVQLYAWPAELATVAPGSYLGFDNTPLPRANVRIGFAFHRDASAATGGFDPGRWPADGSFLYDLGDPATVAALRALEPRYLAWDVTLDGEFRTSAADRPPAADADSRIALRRFWLPMRF
ncbi:MAG: hypothetical protein KDE27_25070, partial [Planctomycetes bacterium]|nr:hypothetical protein [Planctomycetota bacterium]